MFTNSSKSVLLPFLFQMISNKGLTLEGSLSETSHYFSFQSGSKSVLNHSDPLSSDTVGVINIHHPIFKYDQQCGPKGTQTIINMMEGWKGEAYIKGVVLDVNSGGGQASGCSEFAEYIDNYSKPVVTFTKDTIGSAAYYFSSASDAIIAHKHADFIGCIGSMFYSVNVEGILTKKGATINELYADLSPEKNKQSRELNKGNERPLIEHILNPSAQQFHDDVKKYRPQISESALKGDIFSPSAALSKGLIDEIGTLESAIDKVFELAKATPDNSKTNNSKKKTMNKLNVPLMEAIIGSPFSEGETENGIILTDDDALAIENRLSENDTAISNAEIESQTSTDRITELEAESSTVTTAIQNALARAEVEGASGMSNEQGILALSALIAEYGSEDGAQTTRILSTTDTGQSTDIISGVDISAAMNN